MSSSPSPARRTTARSPPPSAWACSGSARRTSTTASTSRSSGSGRATCSTDPPSFRRERRAAPRRVGIMRLSTVILPIYPWSEGRKVWRRAEELGFHAAYTYDHLSWRTFRDGPWYGAIPTLTAAATATERIRLGTLVTSPNFRHPVTLAKDLMTLDDIAGGRLTVGIGAGGSGFDATVLGQGAWTPKERADRFGEFVPLLDTLLSQDVTTYEGRFYSAHEARNIPGCVQRPRLP